MPLALGNPIAASVMQAMLLRVWLRPVSRQSAWASKRRGVPLRVAHALAAIRSMFGVAIGPP